MGAKALRPRLPHLPLDPTSDAARGCTWPSPVRLPRAAALGAPPHPAAGLSSPVHRLVCCVPEPRARAPSPHGRPSPRVCVPGTCWWPHGTSALLAAAACPRPRPGWHQAAPVLRGQRTEPQLTVFCRPQEDADDPRGQGEDGTQAPCAGAGVGAALPPQDEAADEGPGEQGSPGAHRQMVWQQGPRTPRAETSRLPTVNLTQTPAETPLEVPQTPEQGPQTRQRPWASSPHPWLRVGVPGQAVGLGGTAGQAGAPGPPWSQHLCPLSTACPTFAFAESQAVSNDSDSEVEESSELLSPAGRGAARLSFLEKQGSEASVEEGPGSHSGSEEQLEAAEGPEQQLSEFNTNQGNNVAEVELPVPWLHGGQTAAGTSPERQPEFV